MPIFNIEITNGYTAKEFKEAAQTSFNVRSFDSSPNTVNIGQSLNPYDGIHVKDITKDQSNTTSPRLVKVFFSGTADNLETKAKEVFPKAAGITITPV